MFNLSPVAFLSVMRLKARELRVRLKIIWQKVVSNVLTEYLFKAHTAFSIFKLSV